MGINLIYIERLGRQILSSVVGAVSAALMILCAFVCAAQASGIPETEFVGRMEAHILRVRALAEHLINDERFLTEFPEYRNVNKAKFISTILEHDATKVTTNPASLTQMGINEGGANPYIRGLSKRFGSVMKNASGRSTQNFASKTLVKGLNNSDESHLDKIFETKKFTKLEKKLFKPFEEVVDKYDRFMENFAKDTSKAHQTFSRMTGHYSEAFSPEFNRNTISPATYLKKIRAGISSDSQLIKMVNYVETHVNYSKVTRGLDYDSYVVRRSATPYRLKSFNQIKPKMVAVKLARGPEKVMAKSIAKKAAIGTLKFGAKVVTVAGVVLTVYDLANAANDLNKTIAERTLKHNITSLSCEYDAQTQKVKTITTEFETQQGEAKYPLKAKIYMNENGDFRSVYSNDENFGLGYFFVDFDSGQISRVRTGPERYRLSSIPVSLLGGTDGRELNSYKMAQVLTNFSSSTKLSELKQCCLAKETQSCLAKNKAVKSKASGKDVADVAVSPALK